MIEADGRGVVGNRQVELALVVVSLAAVVVDVGIVGIELDRLGVVGNRAVVLAQLIVGVAAIEIGDRARRIELDRLGIVLDRRFPVAALLVEHAALDQCLAAQLLVVGSWMTRPHAVMRACYGGPLVLAGLQLIGDRPARRPDPLTERAAPVSSSAATDTLLMR